MIFNATQANSCSLSNSTSQTESKNKFITKISDKWQDEHRQMRDNCRRVKTDERPVQTSKGELNTNETRVQTSEDECAISAEEYRQMRDKFYTVINESRVGR